MQVTLQICVVLFFALAYIALDNGTENSNSILGIATSASVVGYFCYHLHLQKGFSVATHFKDFQHVSIFLFFSFSFSPVLYKLTDTISTDTIHTTAGLMLFIHLVFHNYGMEKAPIVSNALSLNAALFASVCLASRLASSYDAFVLLSFSVVTFVLFPIFRLEINGFVPLLLALSSLSAAIIYLQPPIAIVVLTFLALSLVLGISPLLFVRWQSFKQTIHGPWDEAVPNVTD